MDFGSSSNRSPCFQATWMVHLGDSRQAKLLVASYWNRIFEFNVLYSQAVGVALMLPWRLNIARSHGTEEYHEQKSLGGGAQL